MKRSKYLLLAIGAIIAFLIIHINTHKEANT